jgi:hypothetical protein
VNGTDPLNQLRATLTNEAIGPWPPGAAFWLVWQMADATGKAQGLAIDNFSFSAASQPTVPHVPVTVQYSATNIVVNWPSVQGQTYQVQFTDDLGTGSWVSWGSPMAGNGSILSFTNAPLATGQRFFRIRFGP